MIAGIFNQNILNTIDFCIVQVAGKPFTVEIIDSVSNYLALMKEIFDFDALRQFVTGKSGKPIKMRIDSMNGGKHFIILWLRPHIM